MHWPGGKDRFARWRALHVVALLAVLILPAPASAYRGANGRVAYESNPGGDREIMSGAIDGSGSIQLTNNTVDDHDPAWSPDGKKIAYSHFNSSSGNYEIWTMNADGSGQTAVVTIAGRNLSQPTWKPDGTKIAFSYEFSATDHDLYQADSTALNSNVTSITLSAADELDPAWSPVDPNKIAYARKASGGTDFELRRMTLSPFADTLIRAEAGHDLIQPAWSPDGATIAYSYETGSVNATYDLFAINADGTGNHYVTGSIGPDGNPAWAPEGNMIAIYAFEDGNDEVDLADPEGGEHVMEVRPFPVVDGNPDWQPVTTAQVRPKGATPLRLPLTIAFKPCTSPNATHDAPLSFGSCTPPVPSSQNLTVGEPAVNGKAANFVGSITVKALASDASLNVSLTDVRCARYLGYGSYSTFGSCANQEVGPLRDYTANLGLEYDIQITDRSNSGAAGTLPTQTITFPPHVFPNGSIPCTATADTSIGSTCSLSTTFNARVPGLIVAGKRASWEFKGARVTDETGTTFAVPGTFQP
jgi:WD40-like Beta Propeller Repeat